MNAENKGKYIICRVNIDTVLHVKKKVIFKELKYWIHRIAIKINPKIEMVRCYYSVFKVIPNFKNPKTLIEKIYWLQLNTDTSLWSLCADKYRVREYIHKKGLDSYLNRIYGVWENADEVDFSILPNEYVLKTNNACGQVIIVIEKNGLDVDEVRKRLKRWYSHPFGVSGGEIHYLKIKPCIIAERLLPIPKDELSMIEYKIWCFSGTPFCVLVTYGRTSRTVNLALYDLDWNPMPQYLKNTKRTFFHPEVVIPKPGCLKEMLYVASVLSADFLEVRVDLYNVDNHPVFGEMTFSTGFGYFTDEFYRILGDKVVLPK